MKLGAIIKASQPDVFKIFCQMTDRPPDREYVETEEHPEDDYNFRKYQEMVTERKAVEI